MKNKISDCRTKDDVRKAISAGKIACVDFCSTDSTGLKCAEHVEKEFSASVRGTLANKIEVSKGKCIICGKKAEKVVYIAKSY